MSRYFFLNTKLNFCSKFQFFYPNFATSSCLLFKLQSPISSSVRPRFVTRERIKWFRSISAPSPSPSPSSPAPYPHNTHNPTSSTHARPCDLALAVARACNSCNHCDTCGSVPPSCCTRGQRKQTERVNGYKIIHAYGRSQTNAKVVPL